ncbi:MAG: hypothetical protein H6907_19785 [Hyphomicrobiales bacterium]|nr:hypothetical protein [Hyphomicrobiales bacterium]
MSATIARSLTLTAALGLCLGLAAACQTTDDPSQGGFVSGVSALNSGAYERRLDQKRGELQNEQWRQQQLQRDLEAARREQANVSAEVREAQQREDALRSEIADLDRRIAVAEQSRTADRAKLARVKEEVEELERAQRLLQADPVIDIESKRRRLAELERRRALLEKALAEAIGG